MKKIYLLFTLIILLVFVFSCSEEDDNEIQIVNTDLSVFSTTDEILYLNESNRTEQLENSLVFNYGNVTPQETDIIYDYNSDFTSVSITIQIKPNITNFNDPNPDNNSTTINLIDFRVSGLEPNNPNYDNIPVSGLAGNTNLPSQFSLNMPPAGHQGSSSSCVGWAVSYGMQGYYRKHEYNLDYTVNGNFNQNSVGSPSYVYNQIEVNCSGSQITDAFDILLSQGTCTIAEMPFLQNDCNTQPNSFQTSVAVENRITDYNTVPITISAIKSHVYAQLPVVIASQITSGYSNTDNINGVEVWTDSSGTVSSYHAMVVSGWDDSLNAFKILNSYGTNINNGYVWMDYSVFTDLVYQAYVGYNEESNQNDFSEIQLSDNINFGNVQVNTNSSIQTLTVSNTGNTSFNITNISSSNNAFTILNGQSTSVAPNSSVDFDIQFSPSNEQSYSGVITVDNTADNANSSNSSIQVTGIGVNNNSSAISLSGNLNFGDVVVGQSDTRTFTISNTGNQSFNVSSVSFPSGVYSANWNSGTINAGGSQNVTVTFQPTSVQSYNGTVTVNHNADSGNNTISISGNGINNNQNVILSYNDHLVKDGTGGGVGNSNGIAEAGEEIDLDVQLINTGNITATNVSATLTTNDSDINITDDFEAWNDIPAGATEWEADFDFDIDPNCPTKNVTFNLQINSDQGSWSDSFTVNVQGSSGGNPISITPTDSCSSSPIMQVNTEYEVNIDVGNYSFGSPIEGESAGGNNVRGFWLSFQVPSNWSANHDVKIYDVSSNFNPVIGMRANCNGPYLGQGSSSPFPLFINDNGNGGNETSDTNIPGSNNGGTPDDIYHVRIYHYDGSQTPNISFKIIVE